MVLLVLYQQAIASWILKTHLASHALAGNHALNREARLKHAIPFKLESRVLGEADGWRQYNLDRDLVVLQEVAPILLADM